MSITDDAAVPETFGLEDGFSPEEFLQHLYEGAYTLNAVPSLYLNASLGYLSKDAEDLLREAASFLQRYADDWQDYEEAGDEQDRYVVHRILEQSMSVCPDQLAALLDDGVLARPAVVLLRVTEQLERLMHGGNPLLPEQRAALTYVSAVSCLLTDSYLTQRTAVAVHLVMAMTDAIEN